MQYVTLVIKHNICAVWPKLKLNYSCRYSIVYYIYICLYSKIQRNPTIWPVYSRHTHTETHASRPVLCALCTQNSLTYSHRGISICIRMSVCVSIVASFIQSMMYGGNFRYLQLSTFLQYYFVRSVVSGQRNEMAENREKHVIEICAFCCCGSKQISLFYLLLIFFHLFFVFLFQFSLLFLLLCSSRQTHGRVNRCQFELHITRNQTEELLRFCFTYQILFFCFCYSFRISLQESALVAICCCSCVVCFLFWLLLLFHSCIVNQDYQHILYLHWNRLELI